MQSAIPLVSVPSTAGSGVGHLVLEAMSQVLFSREEHDMIHSCSGLCRFVLALLADMCGGRLPNKANI